jgi:membrane-associated phospholipid phosphatase
MRRHLLPLTILALLAVGGQAIAAEGDEPRSAYRLSVDLDVPLILISGAAASSFLFTKETGPPACAPLCNKQNVNPFDRPFAGRYSPTWQTVGDISVAATVILVPVGLIIGEPSWSVVSDLVVLGEAALVTSAIQVTLSYAVDRPRPRVYGVKAPLDQRDDANAGRSFFSGHVANTLSLTMVTWTALRRLDRPKLAWAVLGVGIAGSLLVGIARVGAGGHFPTDVLIGYAVGAGVGIAIPALHDRRIAIAPIATSDSHGLSLSTTF